MSYIVFRIGPLPQAPGNTNTYFVYPGRGEQRAFFGSDDESVLQEIASVYDKSELSVEGRLAAAAERLGIASRGMTEDEMKQLGVMTFELALPGVFAGIRDQTSFHHLALAAEVFYEAAPWTKRLAYETIGVALTGSTRRRLWARIVGATMPTIGMVLYDDENAVDRIVVGIERGRWEDIANVSVLGVTLEEEPRFAAEMMQRVYRLPRIPTPLKIEAAKRAPIDDLDALILAASLRALSVLSDEITESHAHVKTDTLELVAVAYRKTAAG